MPYEGSAIIFLTRVASFSVCCIYRAHPSRRSTCALTRAALGAGLIGYAGYVLRGAMRRSMK